MTRNIWALGVGLVVFGGILVFVGIQESRLAATATQAPEEVTLERLIARGAEGNPNIILTDYGLAQNYVFSAKGGRWTGAWVPAVPSAEMAGRPGGLRALIFSTHANNEADLYRRCGQPRLRALVTNKISSLGGEEKRLLEERYPGTDFSRCLIIQEGREPAGAGKVLLMVGGGILLGLAGLGIIVFDFWRSRASHRPPPRMRSRRRRVEVEDEEEPPRHRRRRNRDEDS